MFKKFFLFIFFTSICFAKQYTVSLSIDEESKSYFPLIKQETLSLFSDTERVEFLLKTLNKNDINFENHRGVVLLKLAKRLDKKERNYIITYNHVDSIYDKNRVIRTAALAIYDFLKEQKRGSVYIKNEKFKKVQKVYSSASLDLKDIYSYVKNNNLEVKVNQNNTKLSSLDIDTAQNAYKPTLDIYSNYIQIDKDRAQYSNGLATQKSFESGIKLKQLIYSNKVLQNIKINKLLYAASIKEVKALDDEILYRATLLYLNIIKAKKHFDIMGIKQDFISQNLMFAKQRVEIGVQNRSDVYRWQSELANVNIELSNAKKVLNSLKIELLNLLQVSGDYSFKEYDLNSKVFKLLGEDAIKYLSEKRVQTAFTKQLVHFHSRLKQLRELQKAKLEELNMNKESRYLPTLAFEADAKRVLKRDGAGENFPRAWDDEQYQAIINLNLPIYEGGIKNTKIEKNEIELINLKLNYKNLRNLIVENVRKNYESLSRSYEKIEFSKRAEESSKKNFELVQDRYKNGKENIISLLDAQNAFIVSKLNLNISITDYLSDVSSIYFFSGQINILFDEELKNRVENKIIIITKAKK